MSLTSAGADSSYRSSNRTVRHRTPAPVATPNYLFRFDVTAWGWIHLLLGVIVELAGFALPMGRVWARTIGVILAGVSALVGFAWLPWYPIWGVIFITIAVFVIWALTVHGRDVTKFN